MIKVVCIYIIKKKKKVLKVLKMKMKADSRSLCSAESISRIWTVLK